MCVMDKIAVRFYIVLLCCCINGFATAQSCYIHVASDHRRFETTDGKTFPWLGDTGWLLFNKSTREEATHYLNVRKQQGFNVIQVMILHDMPNNINKYGDSAVHQLDVSKPFVTLGSDPSNPQQYDFWDHVEFIIQEAGKRGIQMALVPLWGSNMKLTKPSMNQLSIYADFLTSRFKKYPNIIWMIGGDVAPGEYQQHWETLATAIKKNDPKHLMTYHPRGRFTSGDWFHQAEWLDFNMFQSGHKRYDQDTSSKDLHHFGEDNWRYVALDLSRNPQKPSIDGEPSYEHIPHGLHDSLEKRWTDLDLRRYAYWSVLAGAPGFTYGENAVMQFHRPGDWDHNFGVTTAWDKALYSPGAEQMKFVKTIISYFGNEAWNPLNKEQITQGERYQYIAAASSSKAIIFYVFEKRGFAFDAALIKSRSAKMFWMNPVSGKQFPAKCTLSNGMMQSGKVPVELSSHDALLIIQQ